jgi:hypothetical protein
MPGDVRQHRHLVGNHRLTTHSGRGGASRLSLLEWRRRRRGRRRAASAPDRHCISPWFIASTFLGERTFEAFRRRRPLEPPERAAESPGARLPDPRPDRPAATQPQPVRRWRLPVSDNGADEHRHPPYLEVLAAMDGDGNGPFGLFVHRGYALERFTRCGVDRTVAGWRALGSPRGGRGKRHLLSGASPTSLGRADRR